jgi:hypothetical protein
MDKMGQIMELNRPVALLSGSASPRIEAALKSKFFPLSEALPETAPLVYRSSTALPQVRYLVQSFDSEQHLIMHICEVGSKLGPNERVIVYFRTIETLLRISSLIPGAVCVYARKQGETLTVAGSNRDYSCMENNGNISAWFSGSAAIICATTAFGLGIDFPGVRYVFIVDLSHTVEGYVQQCGRASRDGDVGRAVLCLIGNDWKKRSWNAPQELFDYAESREECRRKFVSLHQDGEELVVDCSFPGISRPLERCDNCYRVIQDIQPVLKRARILSLPSANAVQQPMRTASQVDSFQQGEGKGASASWPLQVFITNFSIPFEGTGSKIKPTLDGLVLVGKTTLHHLWRLQRQYAGCCPVSLKRHPSGCDRCSDCSEYVGSVCDQKGPRVPRGVCSRCWFPLHLSLDLNETFTHGVFPGGICDEFSLRIFITHGYRKTVNDLFFWVRKQIQMDEASGLLLAWLSCSNLMYEKKMRIS